VYLLDAPAAVTALTPASPLIPVQPPLVTMRQTSYVSACFRM